MFVSRLGLRSTPPTALQGRRSRTWSTGLRSDIYGEVFTVSLGFKQILLFQAVKGGKLMAFDFGTSGNMKHYNQVRAALFSAFVLG